MAAEGNADEWIDRTNEPLGKIGNGYELTSTLQCLYLTNNRIPKIECLENCAALQELVLRQNAIQKVEGIDHLHELIELDLYMNHVEEFEPNCFAGNPKLKRLDLSFNQLRTLNGFPSKNLGNLEELYIIGNKIREISDLHSMPKLVMLELGDNRLRKIEALGSLPNLHGLWLGRNKIPRIEGLESLPDLRRLSLQSNRIETIEGLDHLSQLEELYLSHNGISSMKGVENLTNLRVLDLGANFIEHVEFVGNLNLLKEFWINGNKLQSFEELLLLKNAPQLETVYLEGNPLASDPHYQAKALEILPDSLEQLDALLVKDVKEHIQNASGPPAYERPKPDNPEEYLEDALPDERADDTEMAEAASGSADDNKPNELNGSGNMTEIIESGLSPGQNEEQIGSSVDPQSSQQCPAVTEEEPTRLVDDIALEGMSHAIRGRPDEVMEQVEGEDDRER